MTKEELMKEYAAGLVVGDDDYPDNLLVDKKRTTATRLALDMYDADLYGADFYRCNPKYQEKIISQIANFEIVRKTRSQGISIDIDGKIVLKGKHSNDRNKTNNN